MDPPRVLQLPAYRVVQMPYTGGRPPAAAFFDHWRRFQGWCARRGLRSVLSDVALIGYEPPGRPGARAFLYQVCVPVTEAYQPDDEAAAIASIPGGSYVLCRGELPETPRLFRAARSYAAQQGLAVERGGIEILRPVPDNPEWLVVDAGCRVHG
jgi:hypothetical protein